MALLVVWPVAPLSPMAVGPPGPPNGGGVMPFCPCGVCDPEVASLALCAVAELSDCACICINCSRILLLAGLAAPEALALSGELEAVDDGAVVNVTVAPSA